MADLAVVSRGRAGPEAEVRAAVAFLTRVPVASRAEARDEGEAVAAATTGAAAFPLVGAAIGALAAVPLVALGPSHAVIGAILAVAVTAVLGGGLHLDGLADTVDALAAPPGAAERARTDPRTGSAGVVAIVVVLAVEVAALAELAARTWPWPLAALVVAGAWSRAAAPLLAVTIGRRQPPGEGLGAWFAARVGPGQAAIAFGLAVVAAAGVAALAAPLAVGAVGGAAAAAVLLVGVARARGQLDGDGYGFAIETSFALVLAAAALAR